MGLCNVSQRECLPDISDGHDSMSTWHIWLCISWGAAGCTQWVCPIAPDRAGWLVSVAKGKLKTAGHVSGRS